MTKPVRCLFVIHNAVSYYYIKRYVRVIERHFPDIQIGLCVDRDDQFVDAMAQMEHISIPSLTLDEAITQPWDIAFFAAHGGAHRLPDTTYRIHIQHGLGYGKKVLGSNYTYGSFWTMRDDRCIYDLFFEVSQAEALHIERAFPHIARRISVIGSLTADDLLAARPNSHKYNITPQSRVVLLMSTWGSTSLWQYFCANLDSLALFDSCTAQDVILVSLHPHLIACPATLQCLNRLVARGIHVHWTYDENEAHHFMQLAHVGLCDNTSLALYYCLLGKPLFTFAPHWHSIAEDYDECLIKKVLSNVPAIDSFDEAFVTANQQVALRVVTAIMPEIISYPGQAKQCLVQAFAMLYEKITQGNFYGRY